MRTLEMGCSLFCALNFKTALIFFSFYKKSGIAWKESIVGRLSAMLILHIKCIKNPTIYRKIQMPKTLYFSDLEEVIHKAFDLDRLDIGFSNFVVIRKNGVPVDTEIITFDPVHLQQRKMKTTTITEYFVTVEDEVQLLMDNHIKFHITLEQLKNECKQKIECLEGKGDIVTNEVGPLDLAHINAHYASLNTKYFGAVDYTELFHVASRLNQMKPWQHFDQREIIVLDFLDLEGMVFIQILGEAKKDYGLMIYNGGQGLQTLRQILNGTIQSAEFTLNMQAIALQFIDRAMLNEEDVEVIENHGLQFQGKNNWIRFRRYMPGAVPTWPKHDDAALLLKTVRAMIQITEFYNEQWRFPQQQQPLVFPLIAVQQDGQFAYISSIEVDSSSIIELYVAINDIEKKYFQRKPKLPVILEFDVSYSQLSENNFQKVGERQIYPIELLVMNQQTGEIIAQDMLPFPKTASVCQKLLWEFLNELPNRPIKMYVTKEMKHMLFPLGNLLGVEFIESELPTITQFKQF